MLHKEVKTFSGENSINLWRQDLIGTLLIPHWALNIGVCMFAV